jgi:hypothetical protein
VPLACMHYDEDIVRYNINRVPRKDIVVVAPLKEKEKVYIKPVDHVQRNMTGLREVAEINKKRAEMVK